MEELNPGEYLCSLTRPRNIKFHRKMFCLFNFAFEHWDAPDNLKNFEVFRKNLTILAGFYTEAMGLNGEIILEAKSLKFSKMDEIEFENLFSKIIDTVLKYVLKNYTKDDLEQVIEEILRFT